MKREEDLSIQPWSAALTLIASLLFAGCGSLPKNPQGPEIRAEVVQSKSKQELVFPEKVIETRVTRDLLARTGNNGLCFSGGGTRALTVAYGGLRGLTAPELNLVRKTRYLSCVSGGSWAGSAFSYYRRGPEDDDEFLGRTVTDHNRKTWKFEDQKGSSWETLSPKTLGFTATKNLEGPLAKYLLESPAHEAWQQAIGEVFFEPFGLFDPDHPKFFSLGDESVDRILEANRRLQPEWTRDDFVTLRPERPYLIVNATILWPTDLFRPVNRVNIQYSPLGAGNACFQPLEIGGLCGADRQPTGGGFVAPFAFQSSGPESPPDFSNRGTALVRMPVSPYPFSIWQASGMSSAAYAAALARVATWMLPEAEYWAAGKAGKTSAETIRIGDGGNLENLGLLSLLQRGVRKIVVFNSAEFPLEEALTISPQKDSNLGPLFGFRSSAMPNNTVFHQEEYGELLRALQKEKNQGNLPMVKKSYRVRPNPFWCIAPYDVEILWIYNDLSTKWADQLHPSVKKLVLEGANEDKGPLRDFPNYRTIMEDKLYLVELTNQQVNLLADMYDWSLRQPRAQALLRSMLDTK